MLSDTDKAILDTAAGRYKHAGSLEQVAADRFGLSPTRFWQAVNRLIDTEAALAYQPHTVRLLQRRRTPQARLQRRL